MKNHIGKKATVRIAKELLDSRSASKYNGKTGVVVGWYLPGSRGTGPHNVYGLDFGGGKSVQVMVRSTDLVVHDGFGSWVRSMEGKV